MGRGSGTQLQVAENLSFNVSLKGLIKCGYLYSPKRESEEIRDAIYLQALTILPCWHLSCLYSNMLKMNSLEHKEKINRYVQISYNRIFLNKVYE